MKNNKILVEKIEYKKDDLLVYTDDQKHKSFEARVVYGNSEYPPGTNILFSQYEGSEVYVEKKKYIILDAESIWMIKEK
jgi:co-chaperonin GroES (HSP10)